MIIEFFYDILKEPYLIYLLELGLYHIILDLLPMLHHFMLHGDFLSNVEIMLHFLSLLNGHVFLALFLPLYEYKIIKNMNINSYFVL